ncbi:MAG: DUF3822 family protein [Bacteroidaceae bacterium]|nr:DUF3822 family protein [Bacteroidaceae bacterium]
MLVTGSNYNLNNSLSIRISTDGFSFSAFLPHESQNRFQHISYSINPDISVAANLKDALATLDIVRKKYHSIQVLIDSPCCHIPFDGFEEDRVADIFSYCYPTEQGKRVLYNILSRCNAVVLFCIEKNVHQLLVDNFPNAHFYSIETPIMEHLVGKSSARDTQKMFAVFYPHKMLTLVAAGGKISYVNSFSAASSNDYVYFLLHAWKSQGLNQFTDEMHIVGDFPQKNELMNELRRYVRQIYQIVPSAEFNRSEVSTFPQLPYDLVTLLSISL